MSKILNRTFIGGTNLSRRHFLRTASALSAAGVAGAPFALNLATMASAAAQSAPPDYKAIVCIFLNGGNDHGNTVLATDSSSWNLYRSLRATADAASIALPAVGAVGGVLPIVPKTAQAGRSFALHPAMAPLKTLFDAGRAAVLANVGPLIAPLTLAQYKANVLPRPPKLFSHNDQQSLWQSYGPEGARYGWGGRMGDLLMANNSNTAFTAISAAGNAVFLAGQNIRQYQVGAGGAVAIAGLSNLFGLPSGANPLQNIIAADSSNVFEKDYADVTTRAIVAQSLLAGSMLPASGVAAIPAYLNPNSGAAASNPLAVQMQTVARMIGARNALGVKRQVFFVSLGGFDTHDFQLVNQGDLLAKLAHALAYFDTAMSSLGGVDLRAAVTSFTASDFGRTGTSNGDGTDHGWGAHHFVVGGAVKGGDMYGSFPALGLGHAQDVGSGSLLPQISVDQYGATLAAWFGLSSSQISDVFPNLANFSGANLGFMA